MKNIIVKTVVLCTLALSLFAGMVSVNAVDAGVSVCHDGPHDGTVVQ